MNRKDTKKAIDELMQPYVDGTEIDLANVGGDVWVKKTAEMMWDFVHYRYRIKPKPREFWIEKRHRDRGIILTVQPAYTKNQYIKVREVLDE